MSTPYSGTNANRTLFMGCDPGVTGGIAIIGEGEIAAISLGTLTEREVSDFVRSYAPRTKAACVEKVWGRLGDTPKISPLFISYGFLRGLLNAYDISFTDPTPQKWQGFLGVPGDDKRALRQYMQQRYPAIRWTNATSAAGCLAQFARLQATRVAKNDQRDGRCDHGEPETGIVYEENGDRTTAAAAESAASEALREWRQE